MAIRETLPRARVAMTARVALIHHLLEAHVAEEVAQPGVAGMREGPVEVPRDAAAASHRPPPGALEHAVGLGVGGEQVQGPLLTIVAVSPPGAHLPKGAAGRGVTHQAEADLPVPGVGIWRVKHMRGSEADKLTIDKDYLLFQSAH